MALKNAFKELEIASHKRVVVSGVGCSGKASQYVDGYAAETLHGRAVPFATGIKLAKCFALPRNGSRKVYDV